MSFVIVAIAGAGLAYQVYAGERSANEQRRAQQAADREQIKLERDEKDQKARMEATELRDRMKLAQRVGSAISQGRAGNILTNPTNSTIGSTYTGKTLIGG